MADVSPPSEFQDAFTAFDFAKARTIAASAEGAARSDLEDQIAQAESAAADSAELLAGRIQALARADHYEGLLALADEPATTPLLDLLSEEIRRGAVLHLEGAKRRQERFQKAATKHMAAASEALVLLDTTKARSEIDRIDRRWLSDSQQDELARLIKQTEDAAAERRELDARTAEVLRDHHPSQAPGKVEAGRRSRQVTEGGRGCARSALALLGVLAAASAVMVWL